MVDLLDNESPFSPDNLSEASIDGYLSSPSCLTSNEYPVTRPAASMKTSQQTARGMQANTDGCSCLLNSISFLQKLVSSPTPHGNQIDMSLAHIRNALGTFKPLVKCSVCSSRKEQTMVLCMIARQLSLSCARVVDCFKSICRSVSTDSALSNEELVHVTILTYRANNREKLRMLKCLITIQLEELEEEVDALLDCSLAQDQTKPDVLLEARNEIRMGHVTLKNLVS